MKLIVRNDRDRNSFIEFIKHVKLEKPFTAIFEPVKKRRSLSQNKLFHLWMDCLEGETGTYHEAWKQYFKEKYLTVYTDNCFGKEVKTVIGTSELDTAAFTRFLEQVHLDAAENGLYLSWPDDMGYDDLILKYGG